jgi:precorrin-6B methylase 2
MNAYTMGDQLNIGGEFGIAFQARERAITTVNQHVTNQIRASGKLVFTLLRYQHRYKKHSNRSDRKANEFRTHHIANMRSFVNVTATMPR